MSAKIGGASGMLIQDVQLYLTNNKVCPKAHDWFVNNLYEGVIRLTIEA